jgi:hypothetical protein
MCAAAEKGVRVVAILFGNEYEVSHWNRRKCANGLKWDINDYLTVYLDSCGARLTN